MNSEERSSATERLNKAYINSARQSQAVRAAIAYRYQNNKKMN